jgi:hypothetical protein
LPDRSPISVFAQARGSGEHQVFKFAKHDYYHIVMIFSVSVNYWNIAIALRTPHWAKWGPTKSLLKCSQYQDLRANILWQLARQVFGNGQDEFATGNDLPWDGEGFAYSFKLFKRPLNLEQFLPNGFQSVD